MVIILSFTLLYMKDVIQVNHRDNSSDLVRKGRIIERSVLVDAVQAHLEDRIIPYKNKCVVFGE
jgi:formyltetrahydrofolate deformylase